MSDDGACAHIEAVKPVKHAKKHVCDECVKIGGTWVHLRTCQECGGTHCCDNSPNRHATKHAKATSHPVIASRSRSRSARSIHSSRTSWPRARSSRATCEPMKPLAPVT